MKKERQMKWGKEQKRKKGGEEERWGEDVKEGSKKGREGESVGKKE
jgi:hypothetical protein